MTEQTTTSEQLQAYKLAVIENIAIYVAIVVLGVGVAFFTKSAGGLWALLLLLAINSPKSKSSTDSDSDSD